MIWHALHAAYLQVKLKLQLACIAESCTQANQLETSKQCLMLHQVSCCTTPAVLTIQHAALYTLSCQMRHSLCMPGVQPPQVVIGTISKG